MALQPFVGSWPPFQFRNPIHSQCDSLDGGSAHRKDATGQHKQNKHTQTSMPRVVLEPTTPAFERTRTVHALDRAVIMMGRMVGYLVKNELEGI
jgi:hypothetical protein